MNNGGRDNRANSSNQGGRRRGGDDYEGRNTRRSTTEGEIEEWTDPDLDEDQLESANPAPQQFDGDDESELDEEEQQQGGPRAHPPGYWHSMLQRGYKPGEGAGELAEDIRIRSKLAGPRLMGQLVGKITLSIDRGDRAFEFDFRKASGAVVAAPEGGSSGGDSCSITVSEDNLLKIACGDLNPQMAMLSDKIRVQGRHSLAMYFFNLVAPRARI